MVRKDTLFEIVGIVTLQHASFSLWMEMDACVSLFGGDTLVGLDEQDSQSA